MVRKRAPAQKALSPEKAVNAKRRRSSSTTKDNHIDEMNTGNEPKQTTPSPVQEEEKQIELEQNGDMISDENSSNSVKQPYDELPDFNTFAKELSEKTKTYWGAVMSDYTDFANWTSLIQTVTENEDNIEAHRAVYNCFLRYFPYCYGYWKKFADIEKKNENFDEARRVFQRGVSAIPVCTELWVHYLNFTIQENKGKDNGNEIIRSLFDRAIEAAGMEFKSNKLWDAYIEWEKSLGNLKHVTEIYDQLIATPTSHYMRNWKRFKAHLEEHNLIDILPTEEYSRIMQKVDFIPPGMAHDDDELVITTKPPGEGTVEPTNFETEEEEEPGELSDDKNERSDSLKRKIIAERESLFVETAGEIKKRWEFEDAIKRPYFHVKPLEKAQLNNWKDYLDYEIREGSHKRVCFLFERCLVACALYEEFWRKCIEYLEMRDKVKTHQVYYKACTIHLLKKFQINLEWATFEERCKNYKLASDILSQIDLNFPGMIMITQRRVGLARRMKKIEDVVIIYENAIKKVERIEDKIFYHLKLAHVLAKFGNSKDKARSILWNALDLGKKHKRLYLQLLDLEMHYGSVELPHIERLFTAVEKDMSLTDDFRDVFGLRKIEFYEDNCDDIDAILRVKESYEINQRKREAVKRYLSNSESYESSAKKSKADETTPSLSSIPTPSDPPYIPEQQPDQQWYAGQNSEYYNSDYWSNYAAQYAYQQQQQQPPLSQ